MYFEWLHISKLIMISFFYNRLEKNTRQMHIVSRNKKKLMVLFLIGHPRELPIKYWKHLLKHQYPLERFIMLKTLWKILISMNVVWLKLWQWEHLKKVAVGKSRYIIYLYIVNYASYNFSTFRSQGCHPFFMALLVPPNGLDQIMGSIPKKSCPRN